MVIEAEGKMAGSTADVGRQHGSGNKERAASGPGSDQIMKLEHTHGAHK